MIDVTKPYDMKGKSLKDMCEYIAESKILTKKNGEHPTWEEIWEYSPTGELFMIFEWYEIALKYNNAGLA